MVGYIYVFGSGLLGEFLLIFFVEDTKFPSKVISKLLFDGSLYFTHDTPFYVQRVG